MLWCDIVVEDVEMQKCVAVECSESKDKRDLLLQGYSDGWVRIGQAGKEQVIRKSQDEAKVICFWMCSRLHRFFIASAENLRASFSF